MKKTFQLLFLIAVLTMFTGCVADFGGRAHTITTGTNGTVRHEMSVLRPAIAWGDAKQVLASRRASNTKTGNSVGEKGVEQETSATNVPAILGSAGELIGKAAKAFVAP